MGVFKRHSRGGSGSNGSGGSTEVKITKQDREHLKVRTANVHDPILEAVQEAQPFEQAADQFQDNVNRQSYLNAGELRDVFGAPIREPDVSNPLRARDERPMDTIRGFEYSISGDPTWAQQLETHQYGFRVKPGFAGYTGGMAGGAAVDAAGGYHDNMNTSYQQGVYQAPAPAVDGEKKKKKKRGLFGRKKKD